MLDRTVDNEDGISCCSTHGFTAPCIQTITINKSEVVLYVFLLQELSVLGIRFCFHTNCFTLTKLPPNIHNFYALGHTPMYRLFKSGSLHFITLNLKCILKFNIFLTVYGLDVHRLLFCFPLCRHVCRVLLGDMTICMSLSVLVADSWCLFLSNFDNKFFNIDKNSYFHQGLSRVISKYLALYSYAA